MNFYNKPGQNTTSERHRIARSTPSRGWAIASYVSSAKGAAFILAWGSALGILQRRNPSAEGASHSGASSIIGAMPRTGCVESRFQRSFTIRSESWGYAPGWHETAPLAPNRYVASRDRERVSIRNQISQKGVLARRRKRNRPGLVPRVR